MSNSELRDAIRHMLHLPISFLGGGPSVCKHPSGATYTVDPFGDHDHACACNSGLRTIRHNRVQAALLRFLTFANCDARPATFRDLRLSEADSSRKSPDVILSLPTLSAPLLLDVTVAHPLGATYSHKYAQAGDAANDRAEAKVVPTLYLERVNELGLDFEPFAIETYGAFGRAAKDVLHRVVADVLGRDDHIKEGRADGGGHGALTSGERARVAYGWTTSHIAIAEVGKQMISVALARAISEQFRGAHKRRLHGLAPTRISPVDMPGAPTLDALSFRPVTNSHLPSIGAVPVAASARVVAGGGGGNPPRADSQAVGGGRGAPTRVTSSPALVPTLGGVSACAGSVPSAFVSPPTRRCDCNNGPRPQPPTPGAPIGLGAFVASSPPPAPAAWSPLQANPLSTALEEAMFDSRTEFDAQEALLFKEADVPFKDSEALLPETDALSHSRARESAKVAAGLSVYERESAFGALGTSATSPVESRLGWFARGTAAFTSLALSTAPSR